MTNIDPTTMMPMQPAPAPQPGPYMVDVSIVLASGGRITFTGRDLGLAGLSELFKIIESAIPTHLGESHG